MLLYLQAYHRLAKQYHPDKNPGHEEKVSNVAKERSKSIWKSRILPVWFPDSSSGGERVNYPKLVWIRGISISNLAFRT